MSAVLRSKLWRFSIRLAVCLLVVTAQQTLWAAALPLLRVAHGALNEKVLALWIGVERGLFHKQGLDVEVVDVHSGPATIQALASDEVQVAYTVPSSVLSAAAGGLDIAFFAGFWSIGPTVISSWRRRSELQTTCGVKDSAFKV